ncbi:MAG: AmmeMemoRadiSam system protein A [Bacteroidales bacterium]
MVGYHSIVVSRSKLNITGFSLSDKDKTDLLRIARSTVENITRTGQVPDIDENDFSENIKKHCGAFVTLNKNYQLRGCIGRFTADEPLYTIVQDMAVASATQDSRFNPVTQDELKEIEIEISVLTPMINIESIDEIELGRHGIYIKKGYRTGTFLPQVATETGWTLEEFLGHCSRDKAGIGWDGWKEAEIYIYEAVVFSEE